MRHRQGNQDGTLPHHEGGQDRRELLDRSERGGGIGRRDRQWREIQNNISIYDAVTTRTGSCGPSMVFTNVINRAARSQDEYRATRSAAALMMGATDDCLRAHGGPRFIAAGAVEATCPTSLMAGVPARQVG